MIVEDKSTCAAAFFNSPGVGETLMRLKWRWADEREHEDLQSYAAAFNAAARECDVIVIKMTARPFGLVFMADQREYRMTVVRNGIKYMRTK